MSRQKAATSEGAVIRDALIRNHVPPDHIIVEDNSGTTREQAVESAKILRRLGATTCVVVTTPQQMGRAIDLFAREGITVLPLQAGSLLWGIDATQPWWHWLIPSTAARAVSRDVIYELMAWPYYRLARVGGLSAIAAPPTTASPGRRQLLGLALAWTLFAIYGSFVPLQYRRIPLADAIERFRNLPRPQYAAVSSSDWATNVMLFIPLTFTWMGALVADRRWPARTAAAIAPFLWPRLFSIAIEFGQVWFPGRTTSFNDVAAETLGGVIGIVLWLVVGQLTMTWLRQYSADRRPASQLRWLLQAYVIGFFIYAVIPLDLTMSVTDLYHRYHNGQIVLIPFSYRFESFSDAAYQTLSDIALFVPIGAWVALRLKEYSPSRASFALACAFGSIIAAAIELAQLLVLSRFTDATDIVLGTIGAAIGAKIIFRRDDRGDSVRWR